MNIRPIHGLYAGVALTTLGITLRKKTLIAFGMALQAGTLREILNARDVTHIATPRERLIYRMIQGWKVSAEFSALYFANRLISCGNPA
jgi:hypothetical protein